jgi:hypothetical protein
MRAWPIGTLSILCVASLIAAFGCASLDAFAAPLKPLAAPNVFAPACAIPPRCAGVAACLRNGRCKQGQQPVAGCLLYTCKIAPKK